MTFFIFCNVLVHSLSGDTMDIREKMAIEAQQAIQKSYQSISTSMARTVCNDIDEYTFSDICHPDDSYNGEYRHQNTDSNGEPNGEPYTRQYEDTRPKTGKNTPKGLEMDSKFGVRTGSYLGYKIQPKTPQTEKVNKELCASRSAGTIFKANAIGEANSKYGELASSTSWQYFGGQETGLFAQYPTSIKTQCWCDYYDPRYRPWYAAAVTGPKDMILVLDKSASMNEKVDIEMVDEAGNKVKTKVKRLDIMKDAAAALLDTVTFLDFVQVVVYSSPSKTESYGMKLVRGTSANKKKLKEYIDSIVGEASTCGKCGIEKAFSIFKESNDYSGNDQNSAGCERIISFLTDGVMDDVKGEWLAEWMSGQKKQLPGNAPHIFSYALGSGASVDIPARLACENNGWFAKVEDGNPEALKHAMIRYFEYFANKIPPGNRTLTPRWSEFYMDSSGQGKMSTVSLPVFASKFNKRTFLGVVGIDVLAKDFGTTLEDSQLALKLQTRSSQCIDYNFSIPEDSSQVLVPSYTGATNQCKITKIKASEPYIATSATINQLPDNFCMRAPGWVIALILLSVVACISILCAGYFCYNKKKSRVTPGRTVQPPRAMGQPNLQQQHQQQMIVQQPYSQQQMVMGNQNMIMQQQQAPMPYVGQHQHQMIQQQRMVMLQQQRVQPMMLQQQQQIVQPINAYPVNQNQGVIQVVQAQPIQQHNRVV
jgi:hypothetical protein